MLYFLIGLISCIIGSFLGIGGGIIIVPTLVMLAVAPSAASFASAVTVLTMSTLVSYKNIKAKRGDLKTALLISLGSIPSSFLGVWLNGFLSPMIFSLLYILLIILLLLVMMNASKFERIPQKYKQSTIIKILFCILIGLLAGIFGIGGGPIVVPILFSFFQLPQKKVSATANYITLITSLTTVLTNVATSPTIDYSIILWMIPAAIIGSQIGQYFNLKSKEELITKLFNVLLGVLLLQQFVQIAINIFS